MREIANRWLPRLERGEFNHNLLMEIGKECRTEYHERVKTILEPALVGVLRAATADENAQYIAVEELLQAYVRADEL